MKKCPNCKRLIDDNSSFCEFCGCQIKRSKKPLWIALGAIVVAALLFVLLKPKNEPERVDPDTQAYQACQTVDDYRVYICDYGRNALHYTEAKAFVDQYVADSLQRLLDSLAQERAREQAEAEKRKEDEAYQKCTTVEACDSYLNDYPQGRYVAEVQQQKAELEKAPKSGFHNGHEYVDLALPSGTLWATCNVGATKPEGYGNYYAWGETSTKGTYDWNSYKYSNGESDKLTKYCSRSDDGNNGFTDKLTQLQSGDDPATVNWGSGWRTPSMVQWAELRNNTTNKWTKRNGVCGRLFTSKTNGQTIFLPAAGWEYREVESYGSYWSRSLNTDDPCRAWGFDFYSSDYSLSPGIIRDCGLTVRPVHQK